MAIDWENYGKQYKTQAQSSAYRTNSYVEGNTVRKMSAVPKRREDDRPQKEPRQYPQRKPVSMPGISFRGFLFLTAMLGLIIATGFSYVSTQNNLHEMKTKAISLQTENEELREENQETYQSVLETVDLAEIYEKATQELNMVQAKKNQVYTYRSKKSDMVKQYAEIPDAEN